MSAALPRPPVPTMPLPPAIALARRQYIIAGAAGAVALLCPLALPSLAPLSLAPLGAAVLWGIVARLNGRDAWGMAYASAALQSLTRGRFDEVEAYHARIPPSSLRRGWVARAVAVQKAQLALYRGAPDAAIAAVEGAVAPNVGMLTKTAERTQIASAYSVRAIAHAMIGDAARAEADAAKAEAFAEAMPDALARSRLARAMVLSRSGDMTALAEHLVAHGSLMLEHTMPRERALVRAFRKMARGHRRSVYREPSKPTDGGNEAGALAGWIARVAPEAAAFASDDVALATTSAAATAPIASPPAVRAVADGRRAAATEVATSRFARVRLVAAIGFTVVLAVLFSGTLPSMVAPPTGGLSFPAGAFALSAFYVVAIVINYARRIANQRRTQLVLIAAQRAAALGDGAAAGVLAARAKNTQGLTFAMIAIGAAYVTALLAMRRADFAKCIEECDVGIAKAGTTPAARAVGGPFLPALSELRGISLAASSRFAEAEAELAALNATYPAYAHLALADFRIRLVNAVRQGDFEAARAIALQRTAELPVPMTDDLLADLVIATGGKGLPEEEMQRLDAELLENEAARAWIDAVAPGIRDRFAELLHGRVRVAGAQEAEAGREDGETLGEQAASELARRATLP